MELQGRQRTRRSVSFHQFRQGRWTRSNASEEGAALLPESAASAPSRPRSGWVVVKAASAQKRAHTTSVLQNDSI